MNMMTYKTFTHSGQPQMQVEVILASRAVNVDGDDQGPPLYTIRMRYPRIIHGEVMTHRVFCLAGDAMLDFDLPGGQHGKNTRRVHSMSLREFADKWINGAAKGATSRHNGKTLDHLDAAKTYTAKEIATELGMSVTSNLNALCRKGKIYGAHKRGGKWCAYGRYWMDWRESTGNRSFSLKSRLSKMQIRQINERTGEVQTSTVKDVIVSGKKEVFRVSAGSFSVCGSKDHRVFTDSGWKRIEDIVPGQDQIITYRYGAGENADPNRHNKIDGQWVQTWTRQNRSTIAQRQYHKCAITGELLERSFHLHHVKPRHERPDLAFDLDNVIAVNPDAHKDLHETQGWQIGVPLGSVGTLVDSILSEGECDTYDLEIAGEFPNFFADGVVVHNSRNARSSRAVPVKTMLLECTSMPFIPWHWGKNQKGMQASEDCDEEIYLPDPSMDPAECFYTQKEAWLVARNTAVEVAEAYMEAGYHKQIPNRLLEPFSWIDTLITSCEWDNFLWLRDHADAEPHLQDLARLVKQAIDDAEVQILEPGEWHLPYITQDDWYGAASMVKLAPGVRANTFQVMPVLQKISAARCARISYKPFDGDASYERELERYDMLVSSDRVHASPLEHQATPDRLYGGEAWENEHLHGNLSGWVQFRKTVPNENHVT